MIIIITGASAGFGSAMVEKFVSLGHSVIALGRRIDRLRAMQERLGPSVHPLEVDVRDHASVVKAFATLTPELQAIDILVNNAGLALGVDPAQDASLTDWQNMVNTNINGVLNCTHTILPGMVTRNRGHIINIGSVAGVFPYPGANVYGATKAFLHQFSLNLRADLIRTAIRVTCVEPGMCSGTEFSSIRLRGDQPKVDAIYQGLDALTPEDIAETIYWISSRPSHVNINVISLMPVQQAFGPFAVHRQI